MVVNFLQNFLKIFGRRMEIYLFKIKFEMRPFVLQHLTSRKCISNSRKICSWKIKTNMVRINACPYFMMNFPIITFNCYFMMIQIVVIFIRTKGCAAHWAYDQRKCFSFLHFSSSGGYSSLYFLTA